MGGSSTKPKRRRNTVHQRLYHLFPRAVSGPLRPKNEEGSKVKPTIGSPELIPLLFHFPLNLYTEYGVVNNS
jgi:hypothetical protein